MSPLGKSALSITSSYQVPKSVLKTLAFFDRTREGRCEDVARITGLSPRTVRRRLSELAKVGVLDVVWTKTFPSVRRFRLSDGYADTARSASSLLKEL